MTEQTKRCAIVGIVGRTNAGKSTLLNRMVGEKVSIVSPTVQTTRNTIRGILTEARGQLVFLDTPGLHKAEGALGAMLNRMARHSSAGVDILLVVFDASHQPQLEDDGWMRRICSMDQPVVFVLNKSDVRPFYEAEYKELWATIGKRDVQWVTASAVRPEGATDVVNLLFACAQPSEAYLFPEDVITDYPRKLAIADVVREKLLQRLHQEIPHELGVCVDSIDESKAGWRVSITLYVNRPSQKGIVIGPKGENLQYVHDRAEPELSEVFETRVALDLWVKVERNWMENRQLLRQMGYMT